MIIYIKHYTFDETHIRKFTQILTKSFQQHKRKISVSEILLKKSEMFREKP